jgi:hypothetical protein
MKFRNFNFLNHFIPPRIHTDYDTQFLHPYLLNINYGRNGLWPKRTMAELECGRNVSKALGPFVRKRTLFAE